jgi:hypothetical protein
MASGAQQTPRRMHVERVFLNKMFYLSLSDGGKRRAVVRATEVLRR